MLNIYIVEENPAAPQAGGHDAERGREDPRRVNPYDMVKIGTDAGMLMPRNEVLEKTRGDGS